MAPHLTEALELSEYRSRVAHLYATVADSGDHVETWRRWRDRRDALLTSHPQSPFVGRPTGPRFYPYDPSWRLFGFVQEGATGGPVAAEQPDGTVERFDPIGTVEFDREGRSHMLPLYWTRGYSGGLFLPFGDATNGETTYGSGRYLLDQAKSAFLGFDDGRLVLDFNYAYHPSCVWGDWICPLPRAESRLDLRVEAGEQQA